MSPVVIDNTQLHAQRLTTTLAGALDQLVAAGIAKADPRRVQAAKAAAARATDRDRARDLYAAYLQNYQDALTAGELEAAAENYTLATTMQTVYRAVSHPDHTRESVDAVFSTTLAAAERARPDVVKEFNAAAKEFTAAYDACGGGPFTLAGLMRDGKADAWTTLNAAAARMNTAAAVLDGLEQAEETAGTDLTTRVATTVRGLVDCNALRAAEEQNTWLQGADYAPLRRWLVALCATPRPGFARPVLQAGDGDAAEAKRLQDAVRWLVNHNGATDYQDRVRKLTAEYWQD